MPLTVNTQPSQYSSLSGSGSLFTSKKSVSPGTAFDRFSPDVQDLYVTCSFIPYLGSFVSSSYRFLNNFTYGGLLMELQIVSALKKLLSGLEFELSDTFTARQETHMAKIRTLVCMLETSLMQQASLYIEKASSYGTINVVVTHEIQEILDTVLAWRLLDNIVETGQYVPFGGSIVTTIGILSTSVSFERVP